MNKLFSCTPGKHTHNFTLPESWEGDGDTFDQFSVKSQACLCGEAENEVDQ